MNFALPLSCRVLEFAHVEHVAILYPGAIGQKEFKIVDTRRRPTVKQGQKSSKVCHFTFQAVQFRLAADWEGGPFRTAYQRVS